MAKDLLVRLTCDYCGQKDTTYADKPTNELNDWIMVVTSAQVENGLAQPVMKHYCSKSCAINGIKIGGESAIAMPTDTEIKAVAHA
jgi:hypothetical protein